MGNSRGIRERSPLVDVITSRRSELEKIVSRYGDEGFSWAYLGESFSDLRQAKSAVEGCGSYIDPTIRFHATTRQLRDGYLAYIYAISVKHHSLRWWVSSLSYRFGFMSRTFHRACLVKTGLNLADSWSGPGHLILVADDPVNRSLKINLGLASGNPLSGVWDRVGSAARKVQDLFSVLAHRAFFVKRESLSVFRSWKASGAKGSVRSVQPNDGPLTLLVCWLTRDNVQLGGKFHETYFGNLAEKIDGLGKHIAIVPNAIPGVSHSAMISCLADSTHPVELPHQRLKIFDVVRAAISTIGGTKGPGPTPPLEGMEISHLIDVEMRDYWISNGAASCLLLTHQVKAWAKSNLEIERIVYLYENQPWERALCWEAKKSLPETTLVGFRHTASQNLMLHFYLSPGEEDLAPLPNRITTIGAQSAEQFVDGGYSQGRIRKAGALQLRGMLGELAEYQSENGERAEGLQPAPVLVAVSGGSLAEAADLVDTTIRMFDAEDGVPVVIKFHTLIPFEAIQGMLDLPLPDHVTISAEPLLDLARESSIMIYTTSTSCVQALALGVPAIHMRSQFQLDLDPLETVSDLRLEATGIDDMRTQVRWLLENRKEYSRQRLDRWQKFAGQMYGPVTEESYLAFVD